MSRVLLLCWRDSGHPQGGGSERYLEHVGVRLAAAGHEVVYRTARHPGSARTETVDGVLFSRGGGRLTVYPRALLALVAAGLGLGPLAPARRELWSRRSAFDVVVDTQNGVPFFARLVTRAPVVVLVHHCHREQWPVAGPVLARLGWWIESWLSPRAHRRARYVTVSEPSAAELVDLGVDRERVTVVYNGLDPLPLCAPLCALVHAGTCTSAHRLVVLSRLVPHKQVEDAIEVLARVRGEHPGVTLDVIGDGWWRAELEGAAQARGVAEAVTFHGHLDETAKHRVLARADVHLLPSRKEGWGLAVLEAAQHGIPTIAYDHAVGTRDSVQDGRTGRLVADVDEMTAVYRSWLDDPAERERLGAAARERAGRFSWETTGAQWAALIRRLTVG